MSKKKKKKQLLFSSVEILYLCFKIFLFKVRRIPKKPKKEKEKRRNQQGRGTEKYRHK